MHEEIGYLYRIDYDNGSSQTFDIHLDRSTLDNDVDLGPPPPWAVRREFGCLHPACSLRPGDPCPIAQTAHYLLGIFGNVPSTQIVSITLATPQRTSARRSAIQTAVCSIAGILLPTCGCPVLARFKPMVRFHLPFSSLEETEFRVFSMYALAQFFRSRNGLATDLPMHGLQQFYADVQEINRLAAKKISAVQQKDATINGLLILDTFALRVAVSLETDDLANMEQLFADWLKPDP